MNDILITKIYEDGHPEYMELNKFDVENINSLNLSELNSITVNISKCNNKYSLDLSGLNKLNIPVKIKYGSNLSEKLDLKDYQIYVNELLNLKNKLITNDMSPYEKLLSIYSYATSFPYKSHPSMGSAHNFILDNLDGKICEDYCSFIREILNGTDGIDLTTVSFKILDSDKSMVDHAELMVKLTDEKYDIDGIFVMDPTNDTYVESWKDTFGDTYSPGELFERSLMPINSDRVYKCGNQFLRISNSFPILSVEDFKIALGGEGAYEKYLNMNQKEEIPATILSIVVDKDLVQDIQFCEEIEPIIKNMSKEELYEKLMTPEIPFSVTIDAFKNGLRFQGKSDDDINAIIARVINNYSVIHGEFETKKIS